jgi:hypothetical protein
LALPLVYGPIQRENSGAMCSSGCELYSRAVVFFPIFAKNRETAHLKG